MNIPTPTGFADIVSYDFPIFTHGGFCLFALRMAIFDDVLRSVHVVSVFEWRLAYELSHSLAALWRCSSLLSRWRQSADSAAIRDGRLTKALAGWNTRKSYSAVSPSRRRWPARHRYMADWRRDRRGVGSLRWHGRRTCAGYHVWWDPNAKSYRFALLPNAN